MAFNERNHPRDANGRFKKNLNTKSRKTKAGKKPGKQGTLGFTARNRKKRNTKR